MIGIEHIDNSIKSAIEGQSNLSQSAFEVGGFSTPTMRRLFNNLCNIEGTYLEVGLWMGATFVSSFNQNCISIGIENFGQDFGVVGVKEILEKNIDAHSERAKEVHLHFTDCFSIDKSLLPKGINILFYDGKHDEESQAKALQYFLDNMAEKFAFIVDDINWIEVAKGTDTGFEKLKDKILIEMCWILKGQQSDDPVWHNGVGVFLISKK